VLGLPCLYDEQASLHFGTTRLFTLMDDTTVEVQTEELRHECLLMSFGNVQKLTRKTRRSGGRNAKFYLIIVTLAAKQPAELHNGEDLIAKQREDFRTQLYATSRLAAYKPIVGSSHLNNWPDQMLASWQIVTCGAH
jgi:hypothetical protein